MRSSTPSDRTLGCVDAGRRRSPDGRGSPPHASAMWDDARLRATCPRKRADPSAIGTRTPARGCPRLVSLRLRRRVAAVLCDLSFHGRRNIGRGVMTSRRPFRHGRLLRSRRVARLCVIDAAMRASLRKTSDRGVVGFARDEAGAVAERPAADDDRRRGGSPRERGYVGGCIVARNPTRASRGGSGFGFRIRAHDRCPSHVIAASPSSGRPSAEAPEVARDAIGSH